MESVFISLIVFLLIFRCVYYALELELVWSECCSIFPLELHLPGHCPPVQPRPSLPAGLQPDGPHLEGGGEGAGQHGAPVRGSVLPGLQHQTQRSGHWGISNLVFPLISTIERAVIQDLWQRFHLLRSPGCI